MSPEISVALKRSLAQMENLWRLLNQHGIQLSVGVYPYSQHLLTDSVDSRQVKIWKDFCEQKCFSFINTYPAFFAIAQKMEQEHGRNKLLKEFRKTYNIDTAHFNRKGNEVIFEVINSEFKPDI